MMKWARPVGRYDMPKYNQLFWLITRLKKALRNKVSYFLVLSIIVYLYT